MGKETLIKGVFAGAIIGGIVTLTDRDTRSYVVKQVRLCGNKATYYAKHPADAIHQLNQNYSNCSKQISKGLSTAIDTLNQLQNTTSKIENKETHE